MMRNLIAAPLLALLILPSAAQAAPARKKPATSATKTPAPRALPAFEFRGRRIGDPQPTYDEKIDKIGEIYIWSGIDYHYDETGLTSVDGFLYRGYEEPLREAFIAKYGQPNSTREEILRNGLGAPVLNRITTWRFKEGNLVLQSTYGLDGTSHFEFENPAAQARKKAKEKAKARSAGQEL